MSAALKLTLGWRGSVIAVDGGTAELLGWLAAFFCPPFVRLPDDVRPSHVVSIAIGDVGGAPTGEHVDCLTLDEGHVRLPLVQTPRGVAALDAVAGALVRRSAEGAEVVLAADTRHARLFVMRVVRELAAAHAHGAGDVPLHAAAVASPRGACLFVGPKGAGKTSLLIYALGHPGVRLLGNDRVFVELAGDRAIARGMPTIVDLRPTTAALFPGLAERIAATPRPRGPAQLAAALGAPTAADAEIARIIVVETARAEEHDLEPLAPAAAAARILAAGLIAGGSQAAFFARPPESPLAERVAALAARVPCHRLTLGAQAYATPTLWQALDAPGHS